MHMRHCVTPTNFVYIHIRSIARFVGGDSWGKRGSACVLVCIWVRVCVYDTGVELNSRCYMDVPRSAKQGPGCMREAGCRIVIISAPLGAVLSAFPSPNRCATHYVRFQSLSNCHQPPPISHNLHVVCLIAHSTTAVSQKKKPHRPLGNHSEPCGKALSSRQSETLFNPTYTCVVFIAGCVDQERGREIGIRPARTRHMVRHTAGTTCFEIGRIRQDETDPCAQWPTTPSLIASFPS